MPLQNDGSRITSVVNTAVNYAVGANDAIVRVTVKGLTITLPTAVGATGRRIQIVNNWSGWTGTGGATPPTRTLIKTSAGQIFAGSGSALALYGPNSQIEVISDGANWCVLTPGLQALSPTMIDSGMRVFETYRAVNIGTLLAFIGWIAADITVTGTAAQAVGDFGASVNYSSLLVAGSIAGLRNAVFAFQTRWFPVFNARIGASAFTTVRYFVGLASANITASVIPAGTSFIGFRAATDIPDAAWQAIATDGVGTTTINTGVAVPSGANGVFEFKIDCTDNTSIKYFINDVLVATISTNLPALSTNLGIMAQATTLAAAAVNIAVYDISVKTY